MYWIAFGDIHESTDNAVRIPGVADAQALIVTGDLTNRGSRKAAQSVIEGIEKANPRIFAQPGNMDTDAVTDYLRERGMNLHMSVHELAPGLGLMGVGFSCPTPFGTPGEVSEESLVQMLEETQSRAGQFEKMILAVHEPPGNTKLDRIGSGVHVGSAKVREFIEHMRPDLVLTGHIHESSGMDFIDGIPVVNPGMLADGGYVRINYENGQLRAELEQV